MIKIRRSADKETEGKIIPVLACDHCGQEITSAGLAMYHWLMQDGEPVEDSLRIYHKKPCSYVIERGERALGKQEPGLFYWSELSGLPGFLINHAGFSWERVIAACPDTQLDAVKKVIEERIQRRAVAGDGDNEQ